MAECLTENRGAGGSSLTRVTVLCPWARHINPSLVLVKLRKTRLYVPERLLMVHRESNQNQDEMPRNHTMWHLIMIYTVC